MHQRPRRPSLLSLVALASLGAAVAMPSRADAACVVPAACEFADVAACCTASACTLDGTVTVSGSNCTFDFGTRNLTVSGTIAAQGKTITLKAKSIKVTSLIDVRGPSGANAGNVTIITTGMTAVAYSQEGGTSAVIDASSSAGTGGHVTIQADGMVSLAKGLINANGGPSASGGVVSILTTAGDLSVQIPVTASSGSAATVPNGQILVTAPGNLTVGGSGRLVADLGDIDIDVTGAASFADGSFAQTNGGGGSITLVAGSLSSLGEFRADGNDGSVDLRSVTGPMLLQRLSQGITVGPGVQSVALTTDASGPDGLLTMDMPITANGAEVELDSGGDLVISKKIETTGILDSEAGDISIDAAGDISITKAIVGADVFGEADLAIQGRDVTIAGNFDFRGGLDTSGGHVDVAADRDLVLTGDIFVNVSGADSSDGGSIDFQAGRDMTIGPSVELTADGSPIGAAGSVLLVAGEGFGEHLPGSVLFQGDIKANGHSALAGAFVLIEGCDVSIPAGAVVDITGDAQGTTRVIARSSLTMAGQLKATLANVVEFATGAALSLTGTFSPARSAGPCVAAGSVTANGCERPVCTAANTPTNCLSACPVCGDDQTDFPETCEVGSGGAFCTGNTLCDSRCRSRVCAAPNSCTLPTCNAPADACGFTLKGNGIACDDDDDVCTGVGTCSNGTCRLTPGSVLNPCNDQNPCTGPDTCDPVSGCQNPARPDGPGVPGCDDGAFCDGIETCVSGECQSGVLPCPPTQVCNPQNPPGMECEGPAPCTMGSQCDDGNPCTQNVCDLGTGFCTNPPELSGTNCDSDGDVCNGIRTCDGAGICGQVPTTPPVNCNDNDLCTVDSCNPVSGSCTNAHMAGCCTTAAECNDGNACTADSCNAENTCDHTPIVCNDNDPCTADACDTVNGCTASAIPGCQLCNDASTCPDDADDCTDKACFGGRCEEIPNPNCCQQTPDCADIDSNPCTSNGTCNPVTHRCGTPMPLTGPQPGCGTTCNPATCQAGVCVPGTPLDCSDADGCTSDVCIEGQGCTHTPIALCCFTSAVCVDQNVCTTDSCDLDANRCSHLVADPTCTPCAGADPFECGPRCLNTCQAGRCTEVPPNCNDGAACTEDKCDPTTGCTHTSTCDDHDACTADACDATLGCTHTASPDAPGCMPCSVEGCNDDDLCTTDGCTADGTTCTNDPKTSFDAVLCRLDGMTAKLDAAGVDAVPAKLKKRLAASINKVRAKVVKASSPTAKCNRARGLLGSVRAPLRKLQRSVNKLAGKQIDADLATTLATLAGQAATQADATRAGLGC